MFYWYRIEPLGPSPDRIQEHLDLRVSSIDRANALAPVGSSHARVGEVLPRPHQARGALSGPSRSATLVRTIMSSPVITLDPDDSVDVAHALFAKHRYRHAPVVTGDGGLLGVLSDRDLLKAFSKDTSQAPIGVRSIMKAPVLVCEPGAPVQVAAAMMVEHHVGCLPVLAEHTLVGIVTRSDILKYVVRSGGLDLTA